MQSRKSWSAEFRSSREDAGLTVKDLSRTTGIEEDFILAAEAGYSVLTMPQVEKIIAALTARYQALDRIARGTK